MMVAASSLAPQSCPCRGRQRCTTKGCHRHRCPRPDREDGCMDLKKLSLGERIMGGAAVLLAIDLVALPWHRISVGIGAFSVSASRTGVESPHGVVGVL